MNSDDRKRSIGKVVSVQADRFIVELHGGTDNFTVVGFDNMEYVARLGSFLMIPTHDEYVVAEVVGLRERDPNPKPGESTVEKISSAKFLDLAPLGMLPKASTGSFGFGVTSFPPLYADALYALSSELDRIFESGAQIDRSPDEMAALFGDTTAWQSLPVGQSVVFDDYDVKLKLDAFFGAHSAVLGNTGSGKSCTVASILQSLFEKPDEYRARGATFILFDVNGEYDRALRPLAASGAIGVKRISFEDDDDGPFVLPHWFLSAGEWELLLQASEKAQVPVLWSALGLTSLFVEGADDERNDVRNHILATCVLGILRDETSPAAKSGRIEAILAEFGTDEISLSTLQEFIGVTYGKLDNVEGAIELLGGSEATPGFVRPGFRVPDYERRPFSFDRLRDALDLAILYEEAHQNRQIRDYCSSMVTRLQSLQERAEFAFVRCDPEDHKINLTSESFLSAILGLEQNDNGLYRKRDQIIILDMNAVDDEIVALVTSVITRMIFKVLRQLKPRNRFPVHLVLEEAHRYVGERVSTYALDATRIFERVAKEGRKYGLFMITASQRPSELSKTVLSQCANYVVHRIQNPDDLSQIRQMTPFISETVLKRLPSLPKQHALVFGSAMSIPTTFKVRSAHPRTNSDDARVQELWFHDGTRITITGTELEGRSVRSEEAI